MKDHFALPSGLIARETIEAAKAKLTIPELWRLLALPGVPRRCCRSPFREDKRPSFSIFAGGLAAQDHATGECFDGPGFLARARDLPIGVALREFVELVGGQIHNGASCCGCERAILPAKEEDRSRSHKPDLSRFRQGSPQELLRVATDRAIDFAALERAQELGCLRFGVVCRYDSWILTDPAGWCAEARRLGRLPYPAFGELAQRKVHTIKGSLKNWPVGIGVAPAVLKGISLIAIVEGSADYLAAWHFILRTGRTDVLPVAVLGRAVSRLHPEALGVLLQGRIKFFPHADADGGGLQLAGRLASQLRRAGAQEPTYFDLRGLHTQGGTPVKDLNDLVGLDPDQNAELGGLFH